MFEDIMFWLELAKWIFLFYLAWWWYNWAKEHLAFSPLLTLVVGFILVYFLVIEHPWIGGLTTLTWVLLMSGILYMVPTITMAWNTFFPPKMPKREY